MRLPQPLFSTWDTYFLQIHKISQNINWQCVCECNSVNWVFSLIFAHYICLIGVGVMVFNATFNNISVISWQFYWWRKPLYHKMLYRVHIAWAWFELTRWVVISTDCIVSYISNYHTIMTWRFLKAEEQVTMTTINKNTNTDARHAHQPEYNFIVWQFF